MVFKTSFKKAQVSIKQELKKNFQENKERYKRELKEYLAFKSISTDPFYQPECHECATWLTEHLKDIGLNAELLDTYQYPIVYAEYIIDPKLPTVLLYGHYDVQPAEIEDGWDSDPFTMKIEGEDFYARGAIDNKGQNFYIIKAVENLIQNKALKVNIKFLIEGEEESQSKAVIKSIEQLAKRMHADCIVICDSAMLGKSQPAIAIGMRGVFALNVKLEGAKRDLHSGHFGGLVKNPATEMAKLLAGMYKTDGSIAVEGYYEEVTGITEEDREALKNMPNPTCYEDSIGMKIKGTEENFSPAESNIHRPTIEINGMNSGYSGRGSKTIIPAFATANISGRTVAQQNSVKCIEMIKKHLTEHCPEELKISFYDTEPGCNAIKAKKEEISVKLASKILSEMFNTKCIVYSEPASIPVVPYLLEYISPNGFVTGFGLEDDGWHAANEKFNFDRMEHGFIFITHFLNQYPEWHAKE